MHLSSKNCLPLIVPGVLAFASLAIADLPRSLNFANETGSRINSDVTEGTSNEKEVEFGDLDKDGDLDMIVAVGSSDFGARKNKVYLNDGGVFTESTTLIPEFGNSDVTRNAFIRDYDGDGWNDIYVINDSNTGGFAGNDHIYIAQHSGAVLTGYSEEGSSRIEAGGGLGAACGGVSADFDGDGDMDVYSGNYPGPSQDVWLQNDGSANLPRNNALVPADGDYTVDVATGDMNGDGKIDLLISNWSANLIYYNDNGAGSSGEGDYSYSGSIQNVGDAGANENAMEAADFDNDGDLDIYWTNLNGSTGDRILRNNGNDANNKATFTTLNILPSSVTSMVGRKSSVADFNADGRVDVFVARQAGGTRSVVLRNTSVNNTISFVEWSPAPALPNNTSLNGWHGAVFDTSGDGDVDIVMGAFSGDHLLENTRANEVNEADLGGALPAFFNSDPVAVLGTSATAEVDNYTTSLSSGRISIVLNGPGDYVLEFVDPSGTVFASSDRGGAGVEEAIESASGAGTWTVRVTTTSGGATCNAEDLDGDCVVGFGDLVQLLSVWGCTGCPEDLDGGGAGFSDLVLILGAWGSEGTDGEYLLEVIARN